MFTLDTRSPACPIRLLYTATASDADRADGLHAGGLEEKPWRFVTWPLAVIRGTEHSDYSGGVVERCNYETILADCADAVIPLYGSHGYRALAYDAALGPIPASHELVFILEGLEDYPSVDDDALGDLERTLVDAAWIDFGAKEFAAALAGLFDRLDPDHAHEVSIGDDAIPPLLRSALQVEAAELSFELAEILSVSHAVELIWQLGVEAYNVDGGQGHYIETGCAVGFRVDEWITKAERDPGELSLATVATYFREVA